jgi:hypothetical protein
MSIILLVRIKQHRYDLGVDGIKAAVGRSNVLDSLQTMIDLMTFLFPYEEIITEIEIDVSATEVWHVLQILKNIRPGTLLYERHSGKKWKA